MVANEHAAYVDECLLDLLAAATLNNEGAAQPQNTPLAADVEAVDTWGDYVPTSQLPFAAPIFTDGTPSHVAAGKQSPPNTPLWFLWLFYSLF